MMHRNYSKLFTIGQFSAIHGVTKKTLMWYDEMDLLKPAVIGENGYRYYTYDQSPVLETILMLREGEVSLCDIKGFLCNRSASSIEKLLRGKLTELEETISHLKTVQQKLASRHQDVRTVLDLDPFDIGIVEKEGCSLAVVPIKEREGIEAEVDLVIQETKKHQIHRLHDTVYGAMLPVERLYEGDFHGYTGLYIEIPNPAACEGLYVQPAGRYLRAFCKGSWAGLPGRYREILSYAEAQGLTLWDHSYETGINELFIDTFDDYITQIEIPIKEDT